MCIRDSLSIFYVNKANASCKVVYGGGQNSCTSSSSSTNGIVTQQSLGSSSVITYGPKTQQTKGGLPIYPTQNTTHTPSTGTETLPLLFVSFLGLIGIAIRRKTTKSF